MKKLFKRIYNIIRFSWRYLQYQFTKRKLQEKEKEAIEMVDIKTLSSRDKDRLRENKNKIRDAQPSHFNGMVRGFRNKRWKARSSGTKLYLGKRNKYGLRDILNGQENAAGKCELIIDPSNVSRLNVTSMLSQIT